MTKGWDVAHTESWYKSIDVLKGKLRGTLLMQVLCSQPSAAGARELCA